MRSVPRARALRVLGALAALSSVAFGAAFGCANGGDNVIVLPGNEGGADQNIVIHRDAGHDSHVSMDAGRDRGIIPPIDATSGDTFVSFPDTGSGNDATFGVDVGPSFFAEAGAPCMTLGAQQVQTCGKCGLQSSTCVSAGDAGHHDAGHVDAGVGEAGHPDAGIPVGIWGPFGSCTGEDDAGCVPGTQMVSTCGNCGTQTVVCGSDCELGSTNCVGQGVCAAGSIDFTPQVCDGGAFGGTTRTCTATCGYPDAAPVCVPAPTTLTLSTDTADGGDGTNTLVHTFVNFTVNISDEKKVVPVGGGCPTTAPTSPPQPAAFVTLKNPTAKTATVSIWTSQVTGQPAIDTSITTYGVPDIDSSTGIPNTTAEFENCQNVIQDFCSDTSSDPTACQGSYGGLMLLDLNAVTIPPHGSVVIFVQDQNDNDGGFGAWGVVEITVRTESLM
jgi:hypothetical protein